MTNSASFVTRPWILRVKRYVGAILSADLVGRTIGKVLRDRIPYRGLIIDTSHRAYSHRVKAQILWRIYEGAEVRYIRSHLRTDNDVLELGSSLGVTSAHIIAKLPAGRRAFFVEPNEALLSALRQNVGVHTRGATWDVINAAIWDTDDETVALAVGPSSYESAVFDRRSTPPLTERPATREVPAVRLDTLTRRLGLDRYTLVADIEGAEASFICDTRGGLKGCQQLVIELHDTDYQGSRISASELKRSLLDNHGFRVSAERGPVVVFDR